MAALANPTPPSLSVTVTSTVSVPATAYVWVAVIALDWAVTVPVVAAELSPQAIVYDHGPSFTPASENVALNVKLAPAVALWALAVTTGGTLAMVTLAVAGALAAPRASVT